LAGEIGQVVKELGKVENASNWDSERNSGIEGLMVLYSSSYGGREAALQAQAQQGLRDGEAEVKSVLAQAEEKGKGLVDEARRKANEVADKVVR